MRASPPRLHRPRFTRPPRRGGFSLIEVLTALLIFSIAVVAFVQSMGSSIRIQSTLVSEQRASMLAENILEEIKYTGDLAEDEASGEFEGADLAYRWTTSVRETDIAGLMEVDVVVSWPDGPGQRDYRLSTLMLQPLRR